MSRRIGSISLNFSPAMVLPRKMIGPCEEISRRIARPSVVLPEPDSPTMPSVSPLRTAMSTPSTALMWPTTLRSTPRLIGNQTLRSFGLDHDCALRLQRRRIGLRLGRQQRPRVGMLRRREHALDRPLLDDLALLHHADDVGELAHDAEVVGDEQHRHAEPLLQLLQQREDLRLHGDVERGGRLVGDQQIGLVGERHGDHHALALAAGELVRIARKPRRRDRECRPGSGARACAPAPPAPASPWCSSSVSPICFSIVCSGLSEVIGSWKMIGNAVAANLAHVALVRA